MYPVFDFNRSYELQILDNQNINSNSRCVFNTFKNLKNKGLSDDDKTNTDESTFELSMTEDKKLNFHYKLNSDPDTIKTQELTDTNVYDNNLGIVWDFPEVFLNEIRESLHDKKSIRNGIIDSNKIFIKYLFILLNFKTSNIDIADYIKNIVTNIHNIKVDQEFEFTEDLTNMEKLFIFKSNFIRNNAVNNLKYMNVKNISKLIITQISSISNICSTFSKIILVYKEILINLYTQFINKTNTGNVSNSEIVQMAYLLANVEFGISKGIRLLYNSFCDKYKEISNLFPITTFEMLINTVLECYKHDYVFMNNDTIKNWYTAFSDTKRLWSNENMEGKNTVIERKFKLFVDSMNLQNINTEALIPQFPIHVNCYKFKFSRAKQIFDYVNSPVLFSTYARIKPIENTMKVFDNRENFNVMRRHKSELNFEDFESYYIPIEIYENFIKFLMNLLNGTFIDTNEIVNNLFASNVNEQQTINLINDNADFKNLIIRLQKISVTLLKYMSVFDINCMNFIDSITNKRNITYHPINTVINNLMMNEKFVEYIRKLIEDFCEIIILNQDKLVLKPMFRDTIIMLNLKLKPTAKVDEKSICYLRFALSYLIVNNGFYYDKIRKINNYKFMNFRPGNYDRNSVFAQNVTGPTATFMNEVDTDVDSDYETEFLNNIPIEDYDDEYGTKLNLTIKELCEFLRYFNIKQLYKLLFDINADNFNALNYAPLVCMLDSKNVIDTFYKPKHLSNFVDNFVSDNGYTLDPTFMFKIDDLNKNHQLKTDYSTTAMLNELVMKHTESNDQISGLMFFDIEDIKKDGNFFYSDIDAYINLLIDDIVDNFIGDYTIYDNGVQVVNTTREELKNICRNYYVVTSNCASKHGISYHAYLPIWCKYASLRKFIQKRKLEQERLTNEPGSVSHNRYSVYNFVDELVYSDYMANIRMMFYGKGVNNLNFKSLSKTELENSERRSIFENDTMLNFAVSINQNYNKYNKQVIAKHNKDEIVEKIINSECAKVLSKNKQYQFDNLGINFRIIEADNYEDSIAIGKKMLGMPIALLHRKLLKPVLESVNIVNKRNNFHIFFRVGKKLQGSEDSIKTALKYTFIGIKPDSYISVNEVNNDILPLADVIRQENTQEKMNQIRNMEQLRNMSLNPYAEDNERDYENHEDIRYYTVKKQRE